MIATTKKKILITRAQSDSDKFAKSMKEQGGVPIICPLIETKLRRSPFELQTTSDDWLIFTSVNGVAFFLAQYKAFFIENTCKVAVIGEATKQAIENHGVQVDFMPKVFRAKNMMEEFFHKFNNVKRIIQVKGNLALPTIQDACKERGISYKAVIVYETNYVTPTYQQTDAIQKADFLTASSPSTIDALTQAIKLLPTKAQIVKRPIVCIGPTTASAADKNGFVQIFTPDKYTVEGMIEMIQILINQEKETIK